MKRKSRNRPIAIVVGIAVVAAAVWGVLVLRRNAGRTADRAAVAAYADTVKELSFEGGRLLQTEIKPRVTDLREGDVTPEQFGREADNWIGLYQDIRSRFADATHPKRLDEAARLYDEAFATYIEAFEAFLDASRLATQAERNDAITDAVPIAERADKIFDRARDELEGQMRIVGLDPPSDL